MKSFITYFTLLSISGLCWAERPIPTECNKTTMAPILPDLEIALSALKKANSCTPKYEDDYALLYPSKDPVITETIHFNEIKGTKAELEVLKKFLGKERYEVPPEFNSIAKTCENVLCVLTKLLGDKESAYRVLNIAAKTGYVVSLAQVTYGSPRQEKWSLAEIKVIEKAFERLPPTFYHLKSFTQIRAEVDSPVCSTAAGVFEYNEKYIGVCESKRGSKLNRHMIIHEVAHAYDHEFSVGEHEHFDKWYGGASGFSDFSWVTTKNSEPDAKSIPKYEKKGSFVTRYAETNVVEDFAESVAWYIENPELSLTKTPEKYNFLKNKIFHGQEYISPKSNAMVEKLFPLEQTINQVIQKCLARLTSFNYENGYLYNLVFDNKFTENYCNQDIQTIVASKIASKSLSQQCTFEKEFEEMNLYINQKVDYRMKKSLSLLLSNAQLEDQKIKDNYTKKCLAKNDFTTNCFISELAVASPKGIANKGDMEGVIKSVSKAAVTSNLLAGVMPSFQKTIKLPVNKIELYQACFNEIEEVKFPVKNKTKISLPGAGFAIIKDKSVVDFCSEIALVNLRNKKFKFDENQANDLHLQFLETILESSSYQFMGIRKPFASIDKLVFEYASKMNVTKCALDEKEKIELCQKGILREALSSWAESEKIDSAFFLQESFIEKLMSKIKWLNIAS